MNFPRVLHVERGLHLAICPRICLEFRMMESCDTSLSVSRSVEVCAPRVAGNAKIARRCEVPELLLAVENRRERAAGESGSREEAFMNEITGARGGPGSQLTV